MKTISRKVLVALIFSSFLLFVGLVYVSSLNQPPDLRQAVCQPADLGTRYINIHAPSLSNLELGNTIVETSTMGLLDGSLTNTVLYCYIIRYTNSSEAQQAFERLCVDKREIQVGDESCTFAGNAPQNLAFRRDEFLVLLSGDIGSLTRPASKVDARLHK